MKSYPRFCVIGAGNGGMAMAGHLAIMGIDVTLWNRSEDRIRDIKKYKGIEVSGAVNGFGAIRLVTTDIEKALSQADVIMVAVPSTGHGYIAELCSPYLKGDQIVILNPGRTGGALEFVNVLKQFEADPGVIVAEAQTFLYASRATESYKVVIKSIKNSVSLASIPAYLTPDILRVIKPVFPQFTSADNVLSTSLDNIGAIFHPALLLLNVSRVESGQRFDYYIEGITPSIACILEKMDKERVAIAEALGVRTHTAREWLYLAYNAVGDNLYEALKNNSVYKGILAPENMNHRYISEDIPASLVPMSSIGDMLGIPTPSIKSIIQLGSIIHDIDYMAQGRSVDKLGLSGLSIREIRHLVLEGRLDRQPKIIKFNETPILVGSNC